VVLARGEEDRDARVVGDPLAAFVVGGRVFGEGLLRRFDLWVNVSAMLCRLRP